MLDPGAVELFFRAEPRLEAGDLFIKEYLRKILPDDHREWTEEEVGRFSLLMARIVDERCGPSCVHSREITRRIQLLGGILPVSGSDPGEAVPCRSAS